MDQEKEIRKVIHMLRATAKAAEQAALTGAYSTGGPAFVRQYNAVLEHLKEIGVLREKLFPPLEAEVNSGEAGLLCTQLAAYLEGELPASEEGLGQPGAHCVKESPSITIATGNIGDLGSLKDLGELIRRHLPAWLRGATEQEDADREIKAEAPPEPEPSLNNVESQLAELGAQMQVLAERMRRQDLSVEERLRLAEEMSRVGQEQGRLAREHARLRDES